MGFLSIEPGPIFRQTYSRHTSASPDKRGVWTHAVQNATSNHCLPIRRGNPTIKRKNDSTTPLPFPAARDSLYRRFHGRGMNPSRRTRVRRCRKTIPCTTIGQKTFHKDGTAVKHRSACVAPHKLVGTLNPASEAGEESFACRLSQIPTTRGTTACRKIHLGAIKASKA